MKQQPPQFAPGELSPMEADALNRAMVDLYRLIGGFTAAPPLCVSQDETGVAYSLGDLDPNFSNTSFNYAGVTFTYSGVTSFNFTSNTTLTLSANTVLTFGGTSNSNYSFTAPLEVCGWMYWCFANYTFPTVQVDDWALPATASTGEKIVFRFTISADSSLTGMQFANASQVVALVNTSTANTITIHHESASSTAAYRFNLENAANVTIGPRGMRLFWYDFTSARWRSMNTPVAALNLTVQDDDGSPSYTNVNTIQFDQDDGFSLSNPSAGIAAVNFAMTYNTNTLSSTLNINGVTTVVSVSLPAAGTYLLLADLEGEFDASAGTDSYMTIALQVANSTISDTNRIFNYWPATGSVVQKIGSVGVHAIYTTANTATVTLVATAENTDQTYEQVNEAKLSYLKLPT